MGRWMHFEDSITPHLPMMYCLKLNQSDLLETNSTWVDAKDLKLSTFMSVVFIGSKEMTLRFYDFYSELA